MKHKYIIDRIEEDYAVFTGDNEEEIIVPVEQLDFTPYESLVVYFDAQTEKYLPSPAETQEALEENKKRLHKLFDRRKK